MQKEQIVNTYKKLHYVKPTAKQLRITPEEVLEALKAADYSEEEHWDALVQKVLDSRLTPVIALEKETGLRAQTIRKILRKHGYRSNAKVKQTEYRDDIVSLHIQGLSLNKIALKLGVSWTVVKNVLIAEGRHKQVSKARRNKKKYKRAKISQQMHAAGESTKAIASKLRCSTVTVLSDLRLDIE